MLRTILLLAGMVFSITSGAAVIGTIELDERALQEQYTELLNNPRYKEVTKLFAKGQYRKANAQAIELVDTFPQEYGAHLLTALSYAALDNRQALAKHLQVVSDTYPHFALPLKESVFKVYAGSKRYFLALEMVSGYRYAQLSEPTLLAMASIFTGQTKYEDAKEALLEVLAKNPLNQFALFELALSAYVTRDFKGAEKLLNTLLKSGNSDVKTLQLAASTAVSLGQLPVAEQRYQSLVKQAPDDVLANLNLGVIALINGKSVQAVSYLNKVIQQDELSDDAWIARFIGQIAAEVEQTKLAKAPAELVGKPLFAFARVIENQDPSAISYASALFPDLQYSDVSSLSAAQKMNVLWKGLLYQTGYYQQAIDDNRFNPSERSSLSQLIVARSLIKTDRLDAAKDIYTTLLSKEKTMGWISATIELAEIHYREQKFDLAKSDYQQLLTVDDKRIDWLFQLSSIYLSLEDYEQSINTLLQAAAITSHPLIDNQLAAVYSEFSDNQQKAISIATQALDEHPEFPALLDTLAWAYYQNGDVSQAAKVYTHLLQNSGSNLPPETFYRIGLTFEKANVSGSAVLYELALNAGIDFEGEAHARSFLLASSDMVKT